MSECAHTSCEQCPTDHPWVSNPDAWPELGTRCLYEGLLVYVEAIHPKNGTLTVRFAPMYKPVVADSDPPTFEQCHIDPAGASTPYPGDCNPALVPSDGVITLVVPRGSIKGQDAVSLCRSLNLRPLALSQFLRASLWGSHHPAPLWNVGRLGSAQQGVYRRRRYGRERTFRRWWRLRPKLCVQP